MQTKLNHGSDSANEGSSLVAGAIAVVSTAVKACERQFGCWDPRRFEDSSIIRATIPQTPYTHESLVAAYGSR